MLESSIRVSGVSMNKIQCSKRESLSSDHLIPSQNSCQVQTFYVLMWVLMSCVFLEPPQKNARFSFREICPAEIHQDSGGVVVKDTERPPAERPVDVTTTTSTTSFSKKKSRMAFVWSLNSGYFGQVPKNPDVFCTKLYFW